MIELRGITKAFGGQQILRGVSAALPETGIALLRGGSGSGKTTLLRIIAGIECADSGKITGLEGKRISYVFQEDRLLPHASALENAAAVCNKSDAVKWLRCFGLSGALNKKPAEMSGGMRRRTAIARAFAFGGDLLLMDEPFTGLDAENIAVIAKQTRLFAQKALVIAVHHGGDILPYDAQIIIET